MRGKEHVGREEEGKLEKEDGGGGGGKVDREEDRGGWKEERDVKGVEGIEETKGVLN